MNLNPPRLLHSSLTNMSDAAALPAVPVAKPASATESQSRAQEVAQYEKVRKELRDLIEQKRRHDKQLVLSPFLAVPPHPG